MINNIKKFIVALAVVLSVLTLFAACSETLVEEEASAEVSAEEIILTSDELAAYNGKDGMPAYVAYEGVIYDVSGIPQWATGIHGGNMAGTDITEKLNSASHGTSKLSSLTVVGKVAD